MAETHQPPAAGNAVLKLLIVITIFLTGEVCVLLLKNHRLEATRRGATPQLMKAGDKLDQITGIDSSNLPRSVSFGAGSKLLFVYSSKCPACARNFENWKVIEERVGAGNVLYVSTDKLSELSKDYVQERGIADRTIFLSSAEEIQNLKLTRVPQTIDVSEGKIRVVYLGVLAKETVNSIRQPL
jgi:hypothetical protein